MDNEAAASQLRLITKRRRTTPTGFRIHGDADITSESGRTTGSPVVMRIFSDIHSGARPELMAVVAGGISVYRLRGGGNYIERAARVTYRLDVGSGCLDVLCWPLRDIDAMALYRAVCDAQVELARLDEAYDAKHGGDGGESIWPTHGTVVITGLRRTV